MKLKKIDFARSRELYFLEQKGIAKDFNLRDIVISHVPYAFRDITDIDNMEDRLVFCFFDGAEETVLEFVKFGLRVMRILSINGKSTYVDYEVID